MVGFGDPEIWSCSRGVDGGGATDVICGGAAAGDVGCPSSSWWWECKGAKNRRNNRKGKEENLSGIAAREDALKFTKLRPRSQK